MIRPLTPNDHALFLELCREFYHSDAVLHPVPEHYLENSFQELMRSDTYLICYILEYEAQPVGYALLSRSFSPEVGGTILWIEELYLREAFRSHGIGSAFFRFLEQQHPAARYRLEIEPDNVRAKALYKRHGFEVLPYEQMVRDLDK